MKTSRSFLIRMHHQFWLSVIIQAKEIDLNHFKKKFRRSKKKYFQQQEIIGASKNIFLNCSKNFIRE